MAKQSEEIKQKKDTEKSKEVSIFTKLRYNHKFRLIFIFILMVIVAVMFFFWQKMRVALVVIFITLLAAFGLEATKNDWDLKKLIETKSFQQSKVSRDVKGNILFDKLGNITTDKTIGKKSDDYNCSDFVTQPEAQVFFLKVGGVGHDVNRLDGNKDGVACQSLPKGK